MASSICLAAPLPIGCERKKQRTRIKCDRQQQVAVSLRHPHPTTDRFIILWFYSVQPGRCPFTEKDDREILSHVFGSALASINSFRNGWKSSLTSYVLLSLCSPAGRRAVVELHCPNMVINPWCGAKRFAADGPVWSLLYNWRLCCRNVMLDPSVIEQTQTHANTHANSYLLYKVHESCNKYCRQRGCALDKSIHGGLLAGMSASQTVRQAQLNFWE